MEADFGQAVQEEIRKISPHIDLISITRITGDASNRTYFRLFVNGFKRNTIVMMKMNTPDRGIVSEEIVNLQKKFTEVPFLNIQRFLYSIGVRVPEVYFYSESGSVIFIEDFGNNIMWEFLSAEPGMKERLYELAIKQLIHMQFEGLKRRDNNCYAFWHRFDVKLYMWEFIHFVEYAIERRKGEMRPAHKNEAVRVFQRISEDLSREPDVFTHRDYHSKNLMVMNDCLGILDFQDALLGPPHYDLASLLRDSYTELDEDFIYKCVKFYLDGVKDRYRIKFNEEKFIENFDLVSIQRNLKAAGRFHYIDIVKKNPNYLQFVPGTLKKVKKNMLKYAQLKPLYEILADYMEELR